MHLTYVRIHIRSLEVNREGKKSVAKAENTYQEEHVADGETLEDVGEAGLQLHALLGEHEHADDVPCHWTVMSYVTAKFKPMRISRFQIFSSTDIPW
jgi:hypothetical protein